MIRFLHASDIHLGKPFGRFPEDVRQRLRQARQDSLETLAQAARDGGAGHILLAGDTFDAETPSRTVLRHAMIAMAEAPDIDWVVMPGNHDHQKASEIWDVLAGERPQNVTLALVPAPLRLSDNAVCLPAPCTTRSPGRDLTEWYDHAETGEDIRIGLAHGSIRDFRAQDETDGSGGGTIAPDRAALANLDYLALGDWHGRIEVSPNTWYAGTPEPDSFKPHRPAGALLVEIAARGAVPKVLEVDTGRISWTRLSLDVLADDDAVVRLQAALPERGKRRHGLLDIKPQGQTSLAARAALERAIDDIAPDFLWCAHDLSGLGVLRESADIAMIDERGAVRDAADRLAEAADAGDTVAVAALTRLFSYAMEEK